MAAPEGPPKWEDLPIRFFSALASLMQSWDDAKALRLCNIAARDAVDACIDGAELNVRQACDLPVRLGGAAGALLRRLQRLTIRDAGDQFDLGALWRFGTRHLRDLTQLTSLSFCNTGHDADSSASVRSVPLLRLLAVAPPGLQRLDLHGMGNLALSPSDCAAIMHAICSFQALRDLLLSPALTSADGFFGALAAGASWPHIKCIKLNLQGNALVAGDLALLGLLTGLESLCVVGVKSMATATGMTALSSLAGLKNLALKDVVLTEGQDTVPLGGMLQHLTGLSRLCVGRTGPSPDPMSRAQLPANCFVVLSRLTGLKEICIRNNSATTGQAGTLAALPQLAGLTVFGLSFEPSPFPLFSSLTSLCLMHHGFGTLFPDTPGSPRDLAACVAAFPALKLCLVVWNDWFVPPFPTLESAMLCVGRPDLPLPANMGLAALAHCTRLQKLDIRESDTQPALAALLAGSGAPLPSVCELRLHATASALGSLLAALPRFPGLRVLLIDAGCDKPSRLVSKDRFCLAPLARLTRLRRVGIYRAPHLSQLAVTQAIAASSPSLEEFSLSFGSNVASDVNMEFLTSLSQAMPSRHNRIAFSLLGPGVSGMQC